ncbi:UNKNOWN [Stylonychia lemnae]|uniref:Uncharacterized protein n=1 Tax=Stylonychia lemnae TaxID=5949 RepID=A0A078AVN2_STYLE|nr:UNKNOWN [Stylonychia lemnae]|eukprot:CDW86131.1 UNKNOWN [Stylonychia lemnae]
MVDGNSSFDEDTGNQQIPYKYNQKQQSFGQSKNDTYIIIVQPKRYNKQRIIQQKYIYLYQQIELLEFKEQQKLQYLKDLDVQKNNSWL